jgi:RNA recognition motif-containing protein
MYSNRLLIENLDSLTTENTIETLFSMYGDVGKVKVRRERGMGFVEMTSISEARRVCAHLDGFVLWGRTMKIQNMEDTLRNRFVYLFDRFLR